MDTTRDYYERHASEYAQAASLVDLTSLYAPFLERLSTGAHILDLGCGSGRDAAAFLARGFAVTAIDGSRALVEIAARHLGDRVRQQAFETLSFENEFDGVWACASLLHVPRVRLDEILGRVTRAIKPGGWLYLSFKEGHGERVAADGRFFNDYREPALRAQLAVHPALRIESLWDAATAKPNCPGERWLNVLLEHRRKGGTEVPL